MDTGIETMPQIIPAMASPLVFFDRKAPAAPYANPGGVAPGIGGGGGGGAAHPAMSGLSDCGGAGGGGGIGGTGGGVGSDGGGTLPGPGSGSGPGGEGGADETPGGTAALGCSSGSNGGPVGGPGRSRSLGSSLMGYSLGRCTSTRPIVVPTVVEVRDSPATRNDRSAANPRVDAEALRAASPIFGFDP